MTVKNGYQQIEESDLVNKSNENLIEFLESWNNRKTVARGKLNKKDFYSIYQDCKISICEDQPKKKKDLVEPPRSSFPQGNQRLSYIHDCSETSGVNRVESHPSSLSDQNLPKDELSICFDYIETLAKRQQVKEKEIEVSVLRQLREKIETITNNSMDSIPKCVANIISTPENQVLQSPPLYKFQCEQSMNIMTAEIKKLTTQNTELNIELASLKQKLNDFKKSVRSDESTEGRMEYLESLLENLETDNEDFRTKLKTVEEENIVLKHDNKKLTIKVNDLRKENDYLRNTELSIKTQFDGETEKLYTKIQTLNEEISSLRNVNQEVKCEVFKAQISKETDLSIIKLLEDKIENSKELLEKITNENKENKDYRAKFENKSKEYKEKLKKVTSHSDKLDEANRILREINSELHSKLNGKESEVEDLKRKEKHRRDNLIHEKSTLNKTIDDLLKENEELKIQMERLKTTIHRFSKEKALSNSQGSSFSKDVLLQKSHNDREDNNSIHNKRNNYDDSYKGDVYTGGRYIRNISSSDLNRRTRTNSSFNNYHRAIHQDVPKKNISERYGINVHDKNISNDSFDHNHQTVRDDVYNNHYVGNKHGNLYSTDNFTQNMFNESINSDKIEHDVYTNHVSDIDGVYDNHEIHFRVKKGRDKYDIDTQDIFDNNSVKNSSDREIPENILQNNHVNDHIVNGDAIYSTRVHDNENDFLNEISRNRNNKFAANSENSYGIRVSRESQPVVFPDQNSSEKFISRGFKFDTNQSTRQVLINQDKYDIISGNEHSFKRDILPSSFKEDENLTTSSKKLNPTNNFELHRKRLSDEGKVGSEAFKYKSDEIMRKYANEKLHFEDLSKNKNLKDDVYDIVDLKSMTVSKASLNETSFPPSNQYSYNRSRTNQKEESAILTNQSTSNFVLPTTQVRKVLDLEDQNNRANTNIDYINSKDTK